VDVSYQNFKNFIDSSKRVPCLFQNINWRSTEKADHSHTFKDLGDCNSLRSQYQAKSAKQKFDNSLFEGNLKNIQMPDTSALLIPKDSGRKQRTPRSD